ncbi:helix-turn-helix domain-containing protein [Polycladidibacter stylochi]|uniref:helix-turn-helix domain-containing protein n=1 Tax=Polycladidibacter stylochi TaxID=1807766 RepID=UPI0008324838|nr:helix-turn-helix transcriptional regulator [Pseudovibrio stylochi]
MTHNQQNKTVESAHLGSSFDDFLQEENLLEEAREVAIKRVIAFELEQAMAKQNITKSAMAERLQTSRSQLDRLLDPNNTSVTLSTLSRAAQAVGRKLNLSIT